MKYFYIYKLPLSLVSKLKGRENFWRLKDNDKFSNLIEI